MHDLAQRFQTSWRGLAALCAAILVPLSAHAIDVDPGDYVPAPAGTSALLVYAQHAQRDKLYAAGQPLALQPGLSSNIGIARLAHWTTVGNFTVAPQILVPFGRLEGKDDTSALGRTSGVGDIILAAPVWLLNQAEQQTYLGVAPYLYLPTGSYDSQRNLNLGENRWKFNLQTGFVKGLSSNWWTDITADVMFYGKNGDFGSAHATLRQKPQAQLQGYLRYQFSASSNVYIGMSRLWGGETRVNGIAANDQSEQLKASVGTSFFVAPTTQLMVAAGRDLKVRNGFKENFRLNLRLLQLF